MYYVLWKSGHRLGSFDNRTNFDQFLVNFAVRIIQRDQSGLANHYEVTHRKTPTD